MTETTDRYQCRAKQCRFCV